MKNIAVIIRVFSRVQDTKCLVEIIKKKWTTHNYTLFVAFNGASAGHKLDDYVYENAQVLEVNNNSGHRTGARDLVQNAYNHIKNDNNFDYLLFVESDFWLLDERLILEGIESDKDLATTIWIEQRSSLAVDFFLLKKQALATHTELLNWQDSPETDFRNAVRNAGLSVHVFNALRSIHAPSSMKKILKNSFKPCFYEGGRFRIFEKAKVVTHHIEDLESGLDEKKSIANSVLQEDFFENIALFFPQGSWLRKKMWK